ncbi:unnamed protein product [Vicia faba]|uniref:GTD-binding domain-containing protein n=1 Tax=Vicia faba TaxID=3906 RepID=A0AAV0YJ38_VICFA|nr:unnamed protein product [Vicia faba]
MASTNKFATMLHRNTNKIVVILVYAFLEWILILLLLLNSFFSYLITKFAKCFGLKPPCLFCSRLDNVLHQGNSSTNFHSDAVCETHATEISNLGYCSNHQRLAETNSMCENCLASRPNHHRIGFVSLISHEKHDENGENVDSCSCCNESLNTHLYPPYLLLKPSWEDGNFLGKGSLIVESIEDDDNEGDNKYIEFEINNGEDHDHVDEVLDEHQIFSDIESFILREVAEDRSSSVSNLNSDEKDVEKDDPSGDDDFIHQFVNTSFMQASHLEDSSIEIIKMHFENSVAHDDHRLIPIDLIDSITCLNFESCKLNDDMKEGIEMIQTFASESLVEPHWNVFEGEVLLTMNESAEKTNMRELEETLEVEGLNKNSAVQTSMNDDSSIQEPENAQVDLFRSQEPICSYECTQKDESESSDDDDDEAQNAFEKFISQNNLRMYHSLSNDEKCLEADMEEEQENTPPDDLPPSEEPICSNQCIPEDQSSTSEDDTEVPNAFDDFIAQNNIYTDKTGVNDDEMAEKTISVEKVEEETSHQSSKFSESCEVEESMDGSVASEVEYGDPVLTIDRLKKAVKAEERALSAIYQELEEERSASAIATNQTMAMITRLQEEKAAMQMEALQYQRMMEEQAEYDQEALQILNDLVTKREKEKQELEKEVEEYREKVMDYEAKEKLRLLRRMKDESVKSRDSCCSCCNTGFTDELSVDLNNEEKEENVETISNLEEIALDCVKHVGELDSTLEEFEEEKASILDQLKALEEKIVSLEDGEEYLDDKEDYSNGISYDKNSPTRTIGCLAKKLLPYLDEVDDENEEEAFAFDREMESESNEMQMQKSVPIMSEMDSMKVCVEEEVDRVYERLQALETDREFLQHCMGSIQNGGDEGKDLLQEILQHLRDLKNVELRLKNLDNDPSTIVELHSSCKDL